MRFQFLASTLVRGGAETMAAALSRGLQRRGHTVGWSLLRDRGVIGEDLAADMPVIAGLAPRRINWLRRARITETFNACDGLYVLDHDNAAVLGALAGRSAGVPNRFLAVHTTGRWGGRRSLGRVVRLMLPAYSSVLALSDTHRDYLIRHEGQSPARIQVLPNGIDLGRFRDLPPKTDARKVLGLPAGARVLGTVAMLRPEKNHGLILKVAADLAATDDDLQVVFIGDGPEQGALERRVRELNLEGRVHFLGKRDDVARLLPAMDVFVLASHPLVETQPLAVLEAMAAGIPVVATRVGDLPEMLGDGGELVDPDDHSGLVAAIGRILEDRAYAQFLVHQAGARVKRYTLEESLNVLERLLAGENR